MQNCVPVKGGHKCDQNEWSYMRFRSHLCPLLTGTQFCMLTCTVLFQSYIAWEKGAKNNGLVFPIWTTYSCDGAPNPLALYSLVICIWCDSVYFAPIVILFVLQPAFHQRTRPNCPVIVPINFSFWSNDLDESTLDSYLPIVEIGIKSRFIQIVAPEAKIYEHKSRTVRRIHWWKASCGATKMTIGAK